MLSKLRTWLIAFASLGQQFRLPLTLLAMDGGLEPLIP